MKKSFNVFAILTLTLLLYISIWLNIPIFRQIIVFIYLSFLPGFLLLRIMKMNGINTVDTILFSVGLSLTFSMFTGLLINELNLIGVSQPLSTVPLTIGLSFLTLVIFLMCYKQNVLSNSISWGLQWSKTKDLIYKSAILVLLPISARATPKYFIRLRKEI